MNNFRRRVESKKPEVIENKTIVTNIQCINRTLSQRSGSILKSQFTDNKFHKVVHIGFTLSLRIDYNVYQIWDNGDKVLLKNDYVEATVYLKDSQDFSYNSPILFNHGKIYIANSSFDGTLNEPNNINDLHERNIDIRYTVGATNGIYFDNNTDVGYSQSADIIISPA